MQFYYRQKYFYSALYVAIEFGLYLIARFARNAELRRLDAELRGTKQTISAYSL